jgi:hypothetical protein
MIHRKRKAGPVRLHGGTGSSSLLLDAFTRWCFRTSLEQLGRDVQINPDMPFDHIRRRVDDLRRIVADPAKVSASPPAAPPPVAPGKKKPKGKRPPFSAYAGAYRVFEETGKWGAVWKHPVLGPKFTTEDPRSTAAVRSKLRNAYQKYKARRAR